MAEGPRERVLLVDDEEDQRWLIRRFLEKRGLEVLEAEDAEAALALYSAEQPQVVISDVRMPGRSGVELMQELRAVDRDLPMILISAVEDVATAVEAMKIGAYDFLTKPFENERLLGLVHRALETVALREELRRLRCGGVLGDQHFGASQDARRLLERARLVAETPGISILIQGESGTGKEVLARTIHELSPRREAPFVAVDCGALPETLMESLLFGHVKGAFTGADRDREGLFLEADGGTLFLDELGNLPVGLQSKLLRALQQREVLPLGSDRPRSYDVRLIVATNEDLEGAVEAGRFRLDLYHRVHEFDLRIPPLRERPEDVLHFARVFLAEVAEELARDQLSLPPETEEVLVKQAWTGNLRELRNTIRRGVILAGNGPLQPADLGLDAAAAHGPAEARPDFVEGRSLKEQLQEATAELSGAGSPPCSRTAGATRPRPRGGSGSTTRPCTASSSATASTAEAPVGPTAMAAPPWQRCHGRPSPRGPAAPGSAPLPRPPEARGHAIGASLRAGFLRFPEATWHRACYWSPAPDSRRTDRGGDLAAGSSPLFFSGRASRAAPRRCPRPRGGLCQSRCASRRASCCWPSRSPPRPSSCRHARRAARGGPRAGTSSSTGPSSTSARSCTAPSRSSGSG
ncbi:MAG: sigma 54-interacting transcriptional regulator [Planctomycetota bacterium]